MLSIGICSGTSYSEDLYPSCFQIKLEFRGAGFVEGEKPENPENYWSKARTNNKLSALMTQGPGFEPGPHWWGASALTTAPSLLPQL